MAKASTKKLKNRRLQAADFPLSSNSHATASEICARLRISGRHAAQIKEFLDDLADYVSGWMSRERGANRGRDYALILLERVRATKAAVEKRRAHLFNTVANMQPIMSCGNCVCNGTRGAYRLAPWRPAALVLVTYR
jgi:hypothetical protein